MVYLRLQTVTENQVPEVLEAICQTAHLCQMEWKVLTFEDHWLKKKKSIIQIIKPVVWETHRRSSRFLIHDLNYKVWFEQNILLYPIYLKLSGILLQLGVPFLDNIREYSILIEHGLTSQYAALSYKACTGASCNPLLFTCCCC